MDNTCNKCPISKIGRWCNDFYGNEANPTMRVGRETYRRTKEACEQSKKPGPNSFPKTCLRIESKKAN